MDTKIFKIGGKKLRVSVLETTNIQPPLDKKKELVEEQQKLAKKEELDDVLFFVVDIIKEAAIFVSSSSTGTALVEKAFKCKVKDDGTVVLPGVLSRKKQIIPKLEAAVNDEIEL